jgi:tetratricopeptide (TPR) repeat protein
MGNPMKSLTPSSCLLPLIMAAMAQGQQSLRIWLMLATIILVPGELLALQATEALAQSAPTEISDKSRLAALPMSKAEENIRAARIAVTANPGAEAPVGNLIDALARADRRDEALVEADRFVRTGKASVALFAQRGFLRRERNNASGAVEDFTAALANPGLTTDQRQNVEGGLAEAQGAVTRNELDRAQSDLTKGDFVPAVEQARRVLVKNPGSEPAMLICVESLSRSGQKREALAGADNFVKQAPKNSLLHAQRGFLRRELNDLSGAAEDFAAALAGNGLTADQRSNVEASLAEAEAAQAQDRLDRADAAAKQSKFDIASEESLEVLRRKPESEAAISIRIESLSRMGRKRDAATEADQFIARHPTSSALLARRGFLRRELHDLPGAIEDFTAALARQGLSSEQRRNVEAALAEARIAGRQRYNSRDPAWLKNGATERTGSQSATSADVSQLIAHGHAAGWAYAQRGFSRRQAGDLEGAVQDFDASLARGDLDRRSISNIRYARAEATAMLAERGGNPLKAEASYREFLQTEPKQADGWYKLGYLMLAQKRRSQGADALNKGLEIRPAATAYLDAANAYILTNAPLASRHYRAGLDRWYAGDPSIAGRSKSDFERIKNEVVEADATIKTSASIGGISGRPEEAGGTNTAGGVDTRIRFDGRYLPAVAGLEAFARGLTDKDANGTRETDTGAGLRYRPIPDLNLYIGGMIDHFYQPRSETEFVALWGLGLGADAYPYISGWKPYWDLGTFGSWRTSDQRILEDMRANAGFLYEFRSPVRMAIGPTLLAVAGYDNQATSPWASGVGPSVLSYFWLGGDKYRSYDAIVTVQVGYLFNLGNDQRQRGLRGQVGVTF